MFYDIQPEEQKQQYKQMLSIIGKLTCLFSESDCPDLPYRVQENVFCKYFKAENYIRLRQFHTWRAVITYQVFHLHATNTIKTHIFMVFLGIFGCFFVIFPY